MSEPNRSGRRGRWREKTNDETARASLLQIIRTGMPRQRLDAMRELAALDVRSPERRLPDFEDMSELEGHLHPLARRARGSGPGPRTCHRSAAATLILLQGNSHGEDERVLRARLRSRCRRCP